MPVPQELDVFHLPHVHMKKIKKDIDTELLCTDFHCASSFHTLLNSLDSQFKELKCHEEIEDNHIVGELLSRLPSNAKTTLENDLHSDNRLSELVVLVHDGLDSEPKMSDVERMEFGGRLKSAVSNFTDDLLPHMKEEEEVFLPLLVEYFSEHELRQLRQRVIELHKLNPLYSLEGAIEAEHSPSDPQEPASPSLVSLPPEILLKILSYLSPQDLLRLAPLHSKLNTAAFDGSLWHHLHPVQWAEGKREFYAPKEPVNKEHLVGDAIMENDITKQLMSVEGSVNAFIPSFSDSDDYSVAVEREASVLVGVIEHLLPKIGSHVRTLDLAHGKAVSNEVVFRMLRQCTNLRYLDLSHTGVSDFAFRGMLGRGQSAWQLEHIDLSGCTLVTDTTLQRISQAITSSPHHIRSHDSGGGKKEWKEETVMQPKLRCLIMSGCHLITDLGLRSLALGVGLPYLNYLDLSGLPNITERGLEDIVNASPQLDPEVLFYCDNIPSGPYSDCASGCQNVDCPTRVCCRRLM